MKLKEEEFEPYASMEEFYKSVNDVIDKLRESSFHKEAKAVDEALRYPGYTSSEILPHIFAACREQKRNQQIPREIRKHLARIVRAILRGNPRYILEGDELDY
jgi:hypothetical protein